MEKTSFTPAFISLGSNMGDSAETMSRALGLMAELDGVTLEAASSLYSTQPQGDPNQPWFINQVAKLSCRADVTPRRLLTDLLTIETHLGRERETSRRFGPRRIDIDLLLFGEMVLDEPELVIPHPRLHERAFVLVPLAELAPELVLPCGATVSALLDSIDYRLEGNRIFQ